MKFLISVLFFFNFLASSVLALEIPSNRLLQKPLTLQVAPGKVTAINFETGEKISHYIVSDDTKLVVTTDAPLGQATTFLLREIKPDPIEGATRTSIPNLLISTRLPDGSTRLYEFLVYFKPQISETERIIRVTPESYRLEDQTIPTQMGQVSLTAVADGLNHVLATGQASREDPEVASVKYFLILAQQMPVDQALQMSNISPEVVAKLGEIGSKLR